MSRIVKMEGENFGLFESFSLMIANRGLCYVAGVNNDSDAADSNGTGKTTIFRALTWCLWGETIDGDKADEVIREGAKIAHVMTDVEDDDGQAWKVSRERHRGSPRLRLYHGDGKAWDGPKDQIQQKINDIIGRDFKSFKSTVLYGQNDTAHFADPRTQDAVRKDILHRILNTESLKGAHKWALEQARDVEKKLEAARAKVKVAEAKAAEHDVDAIQAQHDEWEEERKADVAAKRDEAVKHKERVDALREKASTLDGLRAEADELLKRIALNEAKAATDEKAREALRRIDGEIAKVSGEITRVDTETKLLQRALQQLDGEACPLCSSPLEGESAASHIEEMKARGVALASEAADLEESRAKLKALRAKHQAVADAARKAAVEAAQGRTQASALARRIVDAEVAEAQAAEALEAAKTALASAKARAAEANPHAKALKEAKTKVAAYNEEADKARAEEVELETEAAHINFWTRGFSGQGLPSFVLDEVMPYLTERTNAYLDTLADGDITMTFSTQRELKSSKGEMRDEIDISWVIEGMPGHKPSGGQLKKMTIATDLALMDLAATRARGNVDLLILDEVLDGLDREGRARVLILLQSLRARCNSIFVISHETDVAEVFEHVVTTTKTNGVSVLETTS